MLECAASASKAKSVLRQVSRMKLEAFASREKSAYSRSTAALRQAGPRADSSSGNSVDAGEQQSALPLQMLTQWSSINAAFGIKKKIALIICREMLLVGQVQ